MSSMRREQATLGGGCFWCLDAAYRRIQGVEQVVSGYAGGHQPHPTYEQVCSETTGHAEVVQLTYDPDLITYRELLDIFFTLHDPTTRDRQGHDVGTQYRSIVLAHDDEQARTARETIAELDAQKVWDAPIVTQVEPLREFWPAESYHQDYYRRNPAQGYCLAVVRPKVAKLRKRWAHKVREV